MEGVGWLPDGRTTLPGYAMYTLCTFFLDWPKKKVPKKKARLLTPQRLRYPAFLTSPVYLSIMILALAPLAWVFVRTSQLPNLIVAFTGSRQDQFLCSHSLLAIWIAFSLVTKTLDFPNNLLRNINPVTPAIEWAPCALNFLMGLASRSGSTSFQVSDLIPCLPMQFLHLPSTLPLPLAPGVHNQI